MKVSLDTVEITDDQRKKLADVLDGKPSARKANRAEAKAFIWSRGAAWPEALDELARAGDDDDDEDLIGAPVGDPEQLSLEDLL